MSLRHYTKWQWEDTKSVSRAQLRPGDLVFFYPPSLHHVGKYVGGGWMVHAPHTGDVVGMAKIDTMPIAGYGAPNTAFTASSIDRGLGGAVLVGWPPGLDHVCGNQVAARGIVRELPTLVAHRRTARDPGGGREHATGRGSGQRRRGRRDSAGRHGRDRVRAQALDRDHYEAALRTLHPMLIHPVG